MDEGALTALGSEDEAAVPSDGDVVSGDVEGGKEATRVALVDRSISSDFCSLVISGVGGLVVGQRASDGRGPIDNNERVREGQQVREVAHGKCTVTRAR